ncbi:MAG: hypothetical protein KBD21_00730 [Candidatus Pacebacteria bacterium]|nr:hypothetical protein [Candidatus Paceibacterota bacterium]
MKNNPEPITGQSFIDVLNELHGHVFAGVPGESDPFTLTLIEREYISFALALYYQCDHCRSYHGNKITQIHKRLGSSKWEWQEEIVKMVLFLCIEKSAVCESVWVVWKKVWRKFGERIERRHKGLACHIAYAIGIARNDAALMDLAFESIRARNETFERTSGIVRDIDRVVVFMKAATSKNRTDPIIQQQLASCATT